MIKFPIKRFTVDIEALGEITLTELTTEYRIRCNEDPTFDTPTNALINAGLKQEDISKLGESLLPELYLALIEFTYPNASEELAKQKEDGTYVEPTEEDIEESKKN